MVLVEHRASSVSYRLPPQRPSISRVRTSGRLVVIASTFIAIIFFRSSGLSGVQTETCSPSLRASASASGVRFLKYGAQIRPTPGMPPLPGGLPLPDFV